MQHPQDPIRRDRMPDSFFTSVPDYRTIDSTDFHEVFEGKSEPMPACFDAASTPSYNDPVGIPALEPAAPAPEIVAPVIVEQRREFGELQFVATPSPSSYVAVALARAITGIKEVCLVSQRTDGKHQCYALQIRGLMPRSLETKVLTESVKPRRKRGGPESAAVDLPIGLEAALARFDAMVAAEFTPSPLRGGKTVPTHTTLLYPAK